MSATDRSTPPGHRDVVVVAAGAVPFQRQSELAVDELAAAAIRTTLAQAPIARGYIDEVYLGTAKGGSLLGQRSLRYAALANGLPVFNVESACASSGVAFHLAHRSIASGIVDCALVVGVDKLSLLGSGALPVQDTEWEGSVGVSNPIVYALRARRYMFETGATREDLARMAVKSRKFASMNPIAQMRGPVTLDEVLGARMVSDPLTLLQCSPKSDGAAALVVMSRDLADRCDLRGPRVRASTVRSGTFSLAARDLTKPDVTRRAAEAAFEQAGLGPSDLDVVELHDAFSIAELVYTEELGLCADGGAAELLNSGRSSSLADDGCAVVNPSGGLLGRGHPIGATGAAQLVECVSQLNGTAGPRQKANARLALAHVSGGGASGFDSGACSVTILEAATGGGRS